jgi:hypothetical protein
MKVTGKGIVGFVLPTAMASLKEFQISLSVLGQGLLVAT